MKPHARNRGVTLIELMVVLAIFAIVTATIVPEFAGTRDEARLRSTARRLVAALNLARSQAVTTLRIHRVSFDPAGRRFRLEVERDGEHQGFGRATRLPETDGRVADGIAAEIRPGKKLRRRRALAAEKGSTASHREVRFFPDGTADSREILLRDRRGFGVLLRIDPVTGRTSAVTLPKETRP